MIRKLLAASVAGFVLLSGCSSGTTTQPVTVSTITTQAAQDVQTLAIGLPAIVSALQTAGVSSTALAQVQTDLSKVQAAATALAGMPAIPSNATALQTFEVALNDALSVANAVLPGNQYVVAASLLAPLVEGGINLVASQLPAAPAPAMTPDQARAILRSVAAR
ncbi:MAG TPA: hypothetical protein VKS24_25105 [Bradyrhizobium sp.]|nr:hypothetical protein [Bradyrhizobium sp.]